MVSLSKNPGRQPRTRRSRNRPDFDIPSPADEPSPGLMPVGGGFFTTPGGAVSPFDCGRWPDSPYCGGNPFTTQPVGFNFSRVQDECNFGVQIAPVLGFVKLPISQIVYRNPQCRVKEPEPPPPVSFDNVNELVEYTPWALIYPAVTYFYRDGIKPPTADPPIAFEEYSYELSVLSFRYPIDTDISTGFGTIANSEVQFQLKFRHRSNVAMTLVSWDANTINYLARNLGAAEIEDTSDLYAEWDINYTGTARAYFSVGGSSKAVRFDGNNQVFNDMIFGLINNSFILYSEGAQVRNIQAFEKAQRRHYSYNSDNFGFDMPSLYEPQTISISGFQDTFYGIEYYGDFTSIYLDTDFWGVFPITPPLIPPPPPPDDRDCKCMCCDDSLLRALYAKVTRLYNAVGVDDYPVSVPQWITKNNSPQISIATLTRFLSYTIKQLDSISGNYPIKIKIKDADLTQEGDQTQTVTIPNAAEAFAEAIGLLLTIRSETNAALIASVNGMIESGSAKQMAFLAQEYGKANAEFLAYKGKQTEVELPFTFKPNEPQLDKMMVPTTVKVKSWENDDKDDFTDAIAPILELAAMWKAQNYRNLGANSPIEKLRDILKGASDIGSAMEAFRKYPPQPSNQEPTDTPPEPVKDPWDAFIEEVEGGFITKPGITDNTHPYGREFKQRPRIKEIGDDTSDTET